MSLEVFQEIHRIICLQDASEKCAATHSLFANLSSARFEHEVEVNSIPLPGYPEQLVLVPPRNLKRRGMQSQEGRNTLLHAVAHIEFNAINLALDAAYRFRHQPIEFYQDWIRIADDEAKHFQMIRAYLNAHDSDYGDFPAHNGLWEMAVQTQDDIVARMALVPRVLEARGLDVTPKMIERLVRVKDQRAVEILEVIYKDEITHVEKGSHWFKYQCSQRDMEPRATFKKMVEQHMHGQLRGPFNIKARLLAGFDEEEMAQFD